MISQNKTTLELDFSKTSQGEEDASYFGKLEIMNFWKSDKRTLEKIISYER